MEKRRYVIIVLFLLISFAMMQKSFAKYVIQDALTIGIYVDKISPIINVTSDEKTESFQKSSDDTIKKKADITIHTSDNVQIKQNMYQFHPSEPNFGETKMQQFEDGKIFTEEGFYRIITVDTSGNQTEIIILIDKTTPNVWVQYFKKGEATLVRQTASIISNLATENVVNIAKENTVENVQETENITKHEVIEEKEEIKELEIKQNDIEEMETPKEVSENIEETIENNEEIEQMEVFELQEIQQLQESEKEESEIMLMSAGDRYVGNEAEFRNALEVQASVIHVRQSIDFSAPIYINHKVTIINEGITNSLRYGNGGSFIIVQNGGSLVLNGMIVDTNSFGTRGMTSINIQPGGYVTFMNSSIVDGGSGNTGILINQNATLLLWSCEILRCDYGVNLQSNGNLYFGTQEGRCNNFYSNMMAILIDNFYGSCNFSENISIHDNSEYGVYVAKSVGEIYFSAGTYYQNVYCIRVDNTINSQVVILGGSYYSNGWAIWGAGNINVRGGSIYNNYYGVYLHESHIGEFHMEGGSIHSNTSYAIYHNKKNDGACTITGGSILGEIYLNGNDNYVNTFSSYPTFTVTPSLYYFKRKLVRTTNNMTANSEVSKITLTPKDNWYPYVDNEYIVLWNGGNVIARYKDYNGNIIRQETLNGTIGNKYSLIPPNILGYDLISTPSNATGIYTKEDIFVDFKYDLVNVAKVNFEDLLSDVISAKYWYHANTEEFTGEGIDFGNGSIFEKYGYYRIVVRNGVGLEKEVKFLLNKDSLIR